MVEGLVWKILSRYLKDIITCSWNEDFFNNTSTKVWGYELAHNHTYMYHRIRGFPVSPLQQKTMELLVRLRTSGNVLLLSLLL